MNADEFAKQQDEVQHLVEAPAKSVPLSRHYSIAYTDNPTSSSRFVPTRLPTMVQMSPGINSAAYVLQAVPLSANVECISNMY